MKVACGNPIRLINPSAFLPCHFASVYTDSLRLYPRRISVHSRTRNFLQATTPESAWGTERQCGEQHREKASPYVLPISPSTASCYLSLRQINRSE
ncbi:hypothetical protein RRG08_023844 [Elysia crispata]|uniref:Uncharacterized protein n=1 Tax=Elysia crispata TaxID=231223 RepID=A0AAE1AUA7_9GAST|nr:hypothetical protein RRG08_023844 [Elysia crispata]